ncbi:MAG: hypothetical protein IKR74_00585 [Bacilli bacterium]|nr:hypothetical protein [Bacilli bacterium]
MNSKNTMLYTLFGVLFVFTIIYFVTANNISHAFEYDDSQEKYEMKINLIKSMSDIYAKKNMELFDEKSVIYITVQDLVDNDLIDADNTNGDVKDPTSEVKTLNDLKIRLTNKDGKISSKVLTNNK